MIHPYRATSLAYLPRAAAQKGVGQSGWKQASEGEKERVEETGWMLRDMERKRQTACPDQY
jgi:hypothetical protein